MGWRRLYVWVKSNCYYTCPSKDILLRHCLCHCWWYLLPVFLSLSFSVKLWCGWHSLLSSYFCMHRKVCWCWLACSVSLTQPHNPSCPFFRWATTDAPASIWAEAAEEPSPTVFEGAEEHRARHLSGKVFLLSTFHVCLYMVSHLLVDLDWVDLDLGIPPSCPAAQPLLSNSH